MTESTPAFTVALAHRPTWELLQRAVVGAVRLRVVADGTTPSSQIYTLLAGDHNWDIGEMAFSTYLMATDLGSGDIALPIFPAHMVPHAGVFVHAASGIAGPSDLVGKVASDPDAAFTPLPKDGHLL